jgi:DNA repair exonuclease SbcCD nuclease subunit
MTAPVKTARIAHLGDLHWGAVPATRLENELNTIFFPWLEQAQVDAFVQDGDWFHSRLGLDSDDSKASGRAMLRLAQICQAKGIPCRIIKGTLTHDFFQLGNYHALETEFANFRIITTACAEELLPGFNVLWMPEEYPTDYSDFYAPFFFGGEDGQQPIYYDGIFGHGEIDVAAGWSQINEGERHYGGTPCHEAEFLLEHCTGAIQFGHIHKRFRHKKRVGYSGSWTRWCHGEEEDKGFDVLDMKRNKTGWDVKVEFVVNTLAPIYNTVVAGEILDMSDAPDTIVMKLRAAVGASHRLRVKMGDFPIGIEELSIVRGALVNDHSIELVSTARPISEVPDDGEAVEQTEAQLEETSVRDNRLAYLRDPNRPGESRLTQYMHETIPGTEGITEEEVRELTAPLATA